MVGDSDGSSVGDGHGVIWRAHLQAELREKSRDLGCQEQKQVCAQRREEGWSGESKGKMGVETTCEGSNQPGCKIKPV